MKKIVQFTGWVFLTGPKLVQEIEEEVKDYESFYNAFTSIQQTLDDQEEMFGYVGGIEVKLLGPKTKEHHALIDSWRARVADDLYIKKFEEEEMDALKASY